MKVRVLILDDEPLARSVLRHWLADKPEVEIVGECGHGAAGLECLRQHPVDLVFLDVQMPEMDGFAFLRRARSHRIPVIIFVTAYDKYAVRAFEAHALDYLLKPFDKERFDTAYGRARAALEQVEAGQWQARFRALLDSMEARPGDEPQVPREAAPVYPSRLTVREDGRLVLLAPAEIAWIEAEGDYVRLHTGERRLLVHDTLAHLTAQLDPRLFVRIHRSAVVNLEHIRELVPAWNGELEVLLRNGHKLRASRSRRHDLLAAVGQPEARQ
jgi:two-component system LytT family response regulator